MQVTPETRICSTETGTTCYMNEEASRTGRTPYYYCSTPIGRVHQVVGVGHRIESRLFFGVSKHRSFDMPGSSLERCIEMFDASGYRIRHILPSMP